MARGLTEELKVSLAELHALQEIVAPPTRERLSAALLRLDANICRAADMEMLVVMSRHIMDYGIRHAKYNRVLLVGLCSKIGFECPDDKLF